MKIPSYVQDLMSRATYNYDSRCAKHPAYSVGYTIDIEKRSQYGWASFLESEIDRLKKWVERQPGGEMAIIYIPKDTHLRHQQATITIYDPVMQHIEKLIPENRRATQ
ncbi:MAG: hypothetical protein LBN43_07065 [Oscillospiraceae bacterium]|jgi:hypothetical protein|nr:hypothetical protein [Oscillospiraceae bacterium]